MRAGLRTIVTVAAVAAFGLGRADGTLARQGSASTPSPEATAAMQQGEAALSRRQYEEALGAFTQASKLQNKTSASALFGMARAYHGLNAFKSEADACAEALKYVGANKSLESQLHNQRGLAFIELGDKPTDKAFRDAEAEFRTILVTTETLPSVWFNLGVALLKQSRDPEGIQALQVYVESGVRAPDVENAKRMIEEPRRARENFAPEFGIASMGGEYLNLKEMRDTVVMLDFWGTWCGPCVAATPMVQSIAKKFGKDPRFMLISISSDSVQDAQKLKDFIAANKMTWPEVHDTQRKVISQYQVNTYPTYIVIDGEGIIRARITGYSPTETQGNVEKAISNALKALSK